MSQLRSDGTLAKPAGGEARVANASMGNHIRGQAIQAPWRIFMTDDEKRIAIAEACGWTVISDTLCDPKEEVRGGRKTGEVDMNPIAPLPDYLNDLNAIREAIMSLPVEGPVSQKAMRFWMWKVAGQMAVLPSAREYADGLLMMIGKLKP